MKDVSILKKKNPSATLAWRIKNATLSDAAPPQLCVSKRWENLGELGHLSQMYPRTRGDSPLGNLVWIKVRVCQQQRVELWAAARQPQGAHTFTCGTFVFVLLLQEALHTFTGVKGHTGQSQCTHCDWVILYNLQQNPSYCKITKRNVLTPRDLKWRHKKIPSITPYLFYYALVQTSLTEWSGNW